MTLDPRTINLEYGDAVVIYDFLAAQQEAEAGIQTDQPEIKQAFWHLLGAIEREVVASLDPEEYERVRRGRLATLRAEAVRDGG